MSALPKLDPNIEGILRDIAKDPNSLLFGSAHASSIRSPFSIAKRQIGIATPGLSSAEAELLRMHRREMGLVLLQAFDMSYNNSESGSRRVLLRGSGQPRRTWEEAARFSRDFAPPSTFPPQLPGMLCDLLEDRPINSKTRYEIARLAIELDDRPVANQRLAMACMSLEMHKTAISLLQPIVALGDLRVARDSRTLIRASLYNAGATQEAFTMSSEATSSYLACGAHGQAAHEMAFYALRRVINGEENLLARWRYRSALSCDQIARFLPNHLGPMGFEVNDTRLINRVLNCWES